MRALIRDGERATIECSVNEIGLLTCALLTIQNQLENYGGQHPADAIGLEPTKLDDLVDALNQVFYASRPEATPAGLVGRIPPLVSRTNPGHEEDGESKGLCTSLGEELVVTDLSPDWVRLTTSWHLLRAMKRALWQVQAGPRAVASVSRKG